MSKDYWRQATKGYMDEFLVEAPPPKEEEADPFQRNLFGGEESPFDLDRLRLLSKEPISRCQCCGGRSKVYAYRLGSYARVLIWMAFHGRRGEYLHVPTSGAINGGGDYAKLRYWDLIQKSPKNPDPKKRSSGLWKLTELGRDFAHNRTTVSVACYYGHPEGGVLGFEPEQVNIVDALGKYFDYEKLMAGYRRDEVWAY